MMEEWARSDGQEEKGKRGMKGGMDCYGGTEGVPEVPGGRCE